MAQNACIIPRLFGAKATEYAGYQHLDDRALRIGDKKVSSIALEPRFVKKICMIEER
jgi:hypothetical protein